MEGKNLSLTDRLKREITVSSYRNKYFGNRVTVRIIEAMAIKNKNISSIQ